MLAECPHCKAKVDGEVLGKHEYGGRHEPPGKISLLKCPVCNNALLVIQELFQVSKDNYEYTNATRLWPKREQPLDWNIPSLVRESLKEAKKCYKANAYIACAVMCGRTIEAILPEFNINPKENTLYEGLEQLKEKNIIDEKIYKWGDVLRKHRNIGAHASEEDISEKDAEDLLDFTNAICNYIFVLTKKFEEFLDRKEEQS